MFDGFSKTKIDGAGCQINVVHGGSGSPLLLLHGYPQNHVEWHKVAPVLAERFTVQAAQALGAQIDAEARALGQQVASEFDHQRCSD